MRVKLMAGYPFALKTKNTNISNIDDIMQVNDASQNKGLFVVGHTQA